MGKRTYPALYPRHMAACMLHSGRRDRLDSEDRQQHKRSGQATGDRSENPVGDRHPSSDPGWRRTGGTRCNKGRFPNRSTCPQTDSSSAGSSRHSPVGIRRRVRSRTCLRNCRCRRCRLVSSRGGPGGGTWPYWPPTADAISGNDLSFAFTLIEITK